MTCPFCEIAARRAPASLLHEDEACLAFMTLHPTRDGEFLVAPRAHVDHFTDMDDALAAHVMTVAHRLARHARTVLRPLRMGYVVHGFGVAHAHLVVVPQHTPRDILPGPCLHPRDGFELRLPTAAPRAALDAMAARLRLP